MPAKSKKLRIAYVIGSLGLRGASVYLGHLVRHVAGLGHTVTVLYGERGEYSDPPSGPARFVRVRGLTRRFSVPTAALRATLALRPGGADLVHAIGLGVLPVGRALSRLAGLPLVVTPTGFCAGPVRLGTGGGRPRRVVALSEAIRENLVNIGLVPKDRIHVIHGGARVARGEMGPPAGTQGIPVAGTIGCLERGKGLEVFLEASRKVTDAGRRALFLIFGAGSEEERLRRLRRELDLGGQVVMAPEMTTIEGALASIDIFVLPAIRQAFGYTMLEAMARGRAVVAVGAGGVHDVLRDGESGLLVRSSDSDALAARIIELLDAPEMIGRLGRAGRARVAERFTLRRMIEKTDDLYLTLVSEDASARVGASA